MWKWIFAIHENARLREENLELQDELSAMRQRLWLEMDSNRNREDALVDKIVGERTPSRFLLAARGLQEEESVPESTEIQLTTEEENLVETRAKAYAEHYDRLGITYNYDELVRAIRNNPDQYLSN
jgi:hypothetical protein